MSLDEIIALRDEEIHVYQMQKEMHEMGRRVLRTDEQIGRMHLVSEDHEMHSFRTADYLPSFFELGLLLCLAVWNRNQSLPAFVTVLSVPVVFVCAAGLLMEMLALRAEDAYERRRNSWFRLTSMLFMLVYIRSAYAGSERSTMIHVILAVVLVCVQVLVYGGYCLHYQRHQKEKNIAHNVQEKASYERRKEEAAETKKRLNEEIYRRKAELFDQMEHLKADYERIGIDEMYRNPAGMIVLARRMQENPDSAAVQRDIATLAEMQNTAKHLNEEISKLEV